MILFNSNNRFDGEGEFGSGLRFCCKFRFTHRRVCRTAVNRRMWSHVQVIICHCRVHELLIGKRSAFSHSVADGRVEGRIVNCNEK